MSIKLKPIEEYIKEFEQLILALNKKHDLCIGHSEGQFCHLDDNQNNTENIVPELKTFLRKALAEQDRISRESERERIKFAIGNLSSYGTILHPLEWAYLRKDIEEILKTLNKE